MLTEWKDLCKKQINFNNLQIIIKSNSIIIKIKGIQKENKEVNKLNFMKIIILVIKIY